MSHKERTKISQSSMWKWTSPADYVKKILKTEITSPPLSYLRIQHRYSHVREHIVPLRVPAVACTMHNEALQDVTGELWNITEA